MTDKKLLVCHGFWHNFRICYEYFIHFSIIKVKDKVSSGWVSSPHYSGYSESFMGLIWEGVCAILLLSLFGKKTSNRKKTDLIQLLYLPTNHPLIHLMTGQPARYDGLAWHPGRGQGVTVHTTVASLSSSRYESRSVNPLFTSKARNPSSEIDCHVLDRQHACFVDTNNCQSLVWIEYIPARSGHKISDTKMKSTFSHV